MTYFESGGPLMWPLLACSALAVATVLERCLFWLKWGRERQSGHRKRLVEAGKTRDLPVVRRLTESTRDPVIRVVQQALAEPADHGRALRAGADALARQTRRYMRVLETVFTVAPLLGILGTVLGMIVAFGFGTGGGNIEPEHAIGGLSQAFITTATGLSIAIVALIPYNAFSARMDAAVVEIEHTLGPMEPLLENLPEHDHAC